MGIFEKTFDDVPDERRNSGKRLKLHWRKNWRNWMDKRLPAASKINLNHKNIFIFPSRAGLGFIGFMLILLLVAINFENSQIYALTFLLGGIFAVSILHTYANLASLSLEAQHAEPTFAGREAVFVIKLRKRHKRSIYGIQLSWQNKRSEWVDLYKESEKCVTMRFRTGPRGICNPGRIKVETRYPLGIITAWTWVDLKMQTLVYPHPAGQDSVPENGAVADIEGSLEMAGSDDYHALRSYHPGDSIRSVAWKQYAKTGVLNTKQFVDYFDQRLWLDWEQTQGTIEQRLSQLCLWALQAETGVNEYGLQLPGTTLLPARGKHHLEQLLAALALYNKNPVSLSEDKLTRSAPEANGATA
jgi:uncharacterized protein (DUF58 family)